MTRIRVVNLALLAATLVLCGIALLEFSYRLKLTITAKDDRTKYAMLPLDDEEHHFCRGPKDRIVVDRLREFTERPNSEYFEYRDGEARLHSYNEYGYRINEKNWSSRANIKKLSPTVWVFGDSFTRGSLADNTETIPAYLTTMNQEGIYFINFGIGGQGYLNAYRNLQWAQRHLPNKPMAILFIGHANDIADDIRTERRLNSFSRLKSFANLQETSGRTTDATMGDENSASSPAAAANPLSWLASRLGAILWFKSILLDHSQISSHSPAFKKALENSSSFFEVAKQISPAVFGFYIPMAPSDQLLAYGDKDSLAIELLQAAASRNNVPFMSLSHDRLNDLAKNFQPPIPEAADLYGRLDHHLNEKGYFAAAVAIARQMERVQHLRFSLPAQAPDRTNYAIEPQRCP